MGVCLICMHTVWDSFELLSACGVHLFNWRSTAYRCAAILISIRINIDTRSLRSLPLRTVERHDSTAQHWMKEARRSRAAPIGIFDTPQGELISVAYII